MPADVNPKIQPMLIHFTHYIDYLETLVKRLTNEVTESNSVEPSSVALPECLAFIFLFPSKALRV